MIRYSIHGTYAYRTDRGQVRSHDEDRAYVSMNAAGEVLLAVSDGMGGANKGDVASKMAIDVVSALFKKKKPHFFAYFDRLWLRHAFKKANAAKTALITAGVHENLFITANQHTIAPPLKPRKRLSLTIKVESSTA